MGGRQLRFLNSTILDAMMNSVMFHQFTGGNRNFLAGAHDGVIGHRDLGHLTARAKLSGLVVSSARAGTRGDCVKNGTFRTVINTVCLSHNCGCYVHFMRCLVGRGLVSVRRATGRRIGFGDGLVR